MGEGQGWAGGAGGWLFEPAFNRAIKLRQADARITSNARAFLLREADHCLGLTANLAAQLTDQRRQDRIRYQPVELLRQHLYALALTPMKRRKKSSVGTPELTPIWPPCRRRRRRGATLGVH
ncbi:MAG: transposase [Planctomycetes bacterium]|nr:transposase [Planctomycetota bacterium]